MSAMVGIVPADTLSVESCFAHGEGIGLYLGNGSVYHGNKNAKQYLKGQSAYQVQAGDVICIILDFYTATLKFNVIGVEQRNTFNQPLPFHVPELKANQWKLAVSLRGCDEISIVDSSQYTTS